MIRNRFKLPWCIRFSKWLGLTLFRPVLYVLVGATVGLGLLAAAVGSDPSLVMAEFMAEAAVELWPLIRTLLAIWVVFSALAALATATLGEIQRLPGSRRNYLGPAVLGSLLKWSAPLSAITFSVNKGVSNSVRLWSEYWTPGVHPPLVYE